MNIRVNVLFARRAMLGVLWSPPNARRHRLAPRLLLPGGRRLGSARKRGRHSVPFVASIFVIPGLAPIRP